MSTVQTLVSTDSSPTLSQTGDTERKFLTFCLGEENYGVEILRVREIIGLIDITPLPQTPEYVKGVVNLRGKIIPVIELRTKFSMSSVPYTEETCIIVLDVTDQTTANQFQIGVIVDTVSEVLDISVDDIEPPPDFGCAVSAEYILGMGKVKERVIILLDIDKVMTESDIESIRSASNDAEINVLESESVTTNA